MINPDKQTSSRIILHEQVFLCRSPFGREDREPRDETPAGATSTPTANAKAAAEKTAGFVIPGANHALSDPAHAEEFIAKVQAFVAGLSEEPSSCHEIPRR